MEWLAILVVVAVLVSWVMARADSQPRAQERSARLAESEVQPEPPPKSPNEKLADSLNSLREAIREKAAADVQAMRDQLEDANERLAAARQLATAPGLPRGGHVPSQSPQIRLSSPSLLQAQPSCIALTLLW